MAFTHFGEIVAEVTSRCKRLSCHVPGILLSHPPHSCLPTRICKSICSQPFSYCGDSRVAGTPELHDQHSMAECHCVDPKKGWAIWYTCGCIQQTPAAGADEAFTAQRGESPRGAAAGERRKALIAMRCALQVVAMSRSRETP